MAALIEHDLYHHKCDLKHKTYLTLEHLLTFTESYEYI